MGPRGTRTGRAGLVLGIAWVLATVAMGLQPAKPVLADGMSLVSSDNPSYVGQKVTFTTTFPLTCADGAIVTFTVDGQRFAPDTYGNPTGIQVTASLTRVFTTPGVHEVVASFAAGVAPDPVCGDRQSLQQRVAVRPSPAPAKPSPHGPSPVPTVATRPAPAASPAASPSFAPSSASPSAAASSARVNIDSNRVGPTAGVAGFATLALVLLAVLAVMYLRVRRRI